VAGFHPTASGRFCPTGDTYFEDQSIEVVAATLGCSAKTVENQLRESRHRLRGLLGAGYRDAADE
jgi:DNA-directed RNA polymerase specialized sigma24 family protein